MTTNEMADYLIENGIATEEEVQLVSCINGRNDKVMEDILYARTGYRSFEQVIDEDEGDDDSDENGE